MFKERARYSAVAIVLHWTIAALILANIGVGFVMEGLPRPMKEVLVPLHISSGITILLLTVARVLWRLTHRPPPFSPHLAAWERAAAHTVHALLYGLMIGMPLVGWSIISAHPPRAAGAATIWGLIRLPAIAPISHLDEAAQKAAHQFWVSAHSAGGWLLCALLALHIAGALKHQWMDGHPELARMGVGRG